MQIISMTDPLSSSDTPSTVWQAQLILFVCSLTKIFVFNAQSFYGFAKTSVSIFFLEKSNTIDQFARPSVRQALNAPYEKPYELVICLLKKSPLS